MLNSCLPSQMMSQGALLYHSSAETTLFKFTRFVIKTVVALEAGSWSAKSRTTPYPESTTLKKTLQLVELYLLSDLNSCWFQLTSTPRNTWRTMPMCSQRHQPAASWVRFARTANPSLPFKSTQSTCYRNWTRTATNSLILGSSLTAFATWIFIFRTTNSTHSWSASTRTATAEYRWRSSTIPCHRSFELNSFRN